MDIETVGILLLLMILIRDGIDVTRQGLKRFLDTKEKLPARLVSSFILEIKKQKIINHKIAMEPLSRDVDVRI